MQNQLQGLLVEAVNIKAGSLHIGTCATVSALLFLFAQEQVPVYFLVCLFILGINQDTSFIAYLRINYKLLTKLILHIYDYSQNRTI